MATRRPLVQVGGQLQELPDVDTIPAAAVPTLNQSTTGYSGSLIVSDTRATNPAPETYSATNGVRADFKANTSDGLSDGGSFHGVLTFRQYASGTDWTGGGVRQLGFTDNHNLWIRGANASTTWSSWTRFLKTSDAVSTNSANMVVARDASGNFSAGTITATLSGNASSASAVAWAGVSGKPTTVAGYAISDAYTKTETDTNLLARFGAAGTSGTLDWNDATNTRPGSGPTLLLGNATNGPGGTNYYHPFNLEYASKNGTGNVTQMAIGYGVNDVFIRARYAGVWTAWTRMITGLHIGTLVPTPTGGGASGSWSINAASATLLHDTAFQRIKHPGGGSYTTQTASVTGAIAVTLPVGMTNTMMRMTVKVYIYGTNNSFEVHLGGYNYSSGYWVNMFAYIVGNPSADLRYNVRFGYDTVAGKAVVYIGELASTWAYPQVFVTDVQLGYSGLSANWLSGWAVGFEASAFKQLSAAISNCQAGYATSANTANSGVQRDASGNFSAGTITATLSGNASSASAVPWSGVSGKPTTLAGYGITDAIPRSVEFVADLAAVTGNGVYRQESPDSGFDYTSTLNLTSSDGRQQLTIARGGGGMKFRGNTTGSGTAGWSAWRTVLDSTSFNTYAPTLTGTGASGTWGISITGNATTATTATAPTFTGALVSYTLADCNAAAALGGLTARYSTNVAANRPAGTDHAVLTLAYNSSWAGQLACDWRTNLWYVRTQNNGTWGSWVTLGNVTADGTQTLTNKTLTAPTVTERVHRITTNTTAVRSGTYIIEASLILTLPNPAADGDTVSYVNASGTTTAKIARNGNPLMGFNEDMDLDNPQARGTLVFVAGVGWL